MEQRAGMEVVKDVVVVHSSTVVFQKLCLPVAAVVAFFVNGY